MLNAVLCNATACLLMMKPTSWFGRRDGNGGILSGEARFMIAATKRQFVDKMLCEEVLAQERGWLSSERAERMVCAELEGKF
jgi:hypothetical protein